jgi:hypothetical protein
MPVDPTGQPRPVREVPVDRDPARRERPPRERPARERAPRTPPVQPPTDERDDSEPEPPKGRHVDLEVAGVHSETPLARA